MNQILARIRQRLKETDWIYALKARLTDNDYRTGKKASATSHKSKAQMDSEKSMLRAYWGVTPLQYYIYRLANRDLTDEELRDYIPSAYFYNTYFRDRYTPDQFKRLSSKRCLYDIFKERGIPTPEVLAVIRNKQMIQEGNGRDKAYAGNTLQLLENEFHAGDRIFLKPDDGKGGAGIISAIRTSSGWEIEEGTPVTTETLLGRLHRRATYVVQKGLKQHQDLDRINSSSINTLRVVMQRQQDSGKARIAAVALRMGRDKKHVDNSAQGGVSVFIDPLTGTFAPKAYTEHTHEEFDRHPDSGYVFSGSSIPGWHMISRQIIEYSEKFPELKDWAWDVALLPEGICMIELNPWYGIEHLQCTGGGMRRVLNVYPATEDKSA